MNNTLQTLSFDSSMTELSNAELQTLEGGSFYANAAFAVGFAAHCLWEFAQTAGEYQSSLPPSLKK